MYKGSTIITENGGYADLHLHTRLSDGTLSVEELLTLCKRKGLRCISITDHDNLDSFKIAEQPQMYYVKSKGFRRIEKAAKDGKLYYLHSDAYEYCVSNVHAIEKTDDMISYEKISPTQRMDLFDASVFACVRWIESHTKMERIRNWWK